MAKAIPAVAWKRAVETACLTFERVMAPLVETTSGVGRLIAAKFDRLVAAEKVIVSKTTEDAGRKALASGLPRNPEINQLVVLKVIEHAQEQADPNVRELWSNLLAREMTSGQVHPEIVNVLSKLTTKDAILLLEVDKKQPRNFFQVLSVAASNSAPVMILTGMRRKPLTLSHVMLERFGLITKMEQGGWSMTAFGKGFVKTVSPLESATAKASEC